MHDLTAILAIAIFLVAMQEACLPKKYNNTCPGGEVILIEGNDVFLDNDIGGMCFHNIIYPQKPEDFPIGSRVPEGMFMHLEDEVW